MAKRKLSNFDFTRKGCHISAVSAEVGGPANGRTCLIYKGVSSHKTEENMEKEMIEKSAVNEMVLKAVADAVAPIQKSLDEANAKVASYEAAAAEAKVAVRKAALADAMGADNPELDAKLEVLKSVDDAVFELVLKGVKNVEKEKEFKEMGSNKAKSVKEVEEGSRLADMIKKQYNLK